MTKIIRLVRRVGKALVSVRNWPLEGVQNFV